MSEILVNTIKKADGTGSITVPANTGTLVDTSGAAFTGSVTTSGNLDISDASAGGSYRTLGFTVGSNSGRIVFTGDSFSDANYGQGDITIQTQSSGGQIRFGTGAAGTNMMKIDASGRVTMPYQPAFAAQGNGGNNGNSSNNNITALSSKYDIGTNFSAGVFTAPVTGLYEFTFAILYNSGTGRTRIRVNGSDYFGAVNGSGALQLRETPSGANLFATFLIQMSQNDTAQMYSQDGNYNTESSYLYFAGKLVG